MGTWFSKAKVSVLASEIVKIPEQREKLLKALNSPPPKKVKFKEPIEEPSPALNNVQEDPIVILHTMDSRKEDHPPFYVSLMMGDLLLHNDMLDSGSASNTMTRKVMEQLNLKTTRPYRNVCAMDSGEVDVVGIILNHQVRLVKYPDIHIAMDILGRGSCGMRDPLSSHSN